MWEGVDNELRVGNDGRPLLLPYFLEIKTKKKHKLSFYIDIHHGNNTHTNICKWHSQDVC